MYVIRWVMLAVFVASIMTMVAVRSTGYTEAKAENGKYYLYVRSHRCEATREDYEEVRWRNRVSGTATATMMVSLFSLIALESTRRHWRHTTGH
jgi:hypothetical protein